MKTRYKFFRLDGGKTIKSDSGDLKWKKGEWQKIDDELNIKIEKAIYSQNLVCEFLKNNGFILSEVKKPTSNGIDIVAIKNGKNVAVEVKSVIFTSRSYRVNKPNIKSDYIAIVMPSGNIHFEVMKDWLKLSNKNMTRQITKLVNFYKLIYEK